jgi:hypothetical protein
VTLNVTKTGWKVFSDLWKKVLEEWGGVPVGHGEGLKYLWKKRRINKKTSQEESFIC